MADIDDIIDNFSLLDEWDDRYRYVIERSLNDFVWRPLMVVTNDTGTVIFADPDPPPDSSAFYRARILE